MFLDLPNVPCRFSRVSGSYLLAALLITVSVGCDSKKSDSSLTDQSDDTSSELTQIQGEVAIDGSSTVAPISEAAAEQFEKKFTNVKSHRGDVRHRRWFQTIHQRRNGHLRCIASDQRFRVQGL